MEKPTVNKNPLGDILIITAGLFWGSMGLFVRHLNALGFTSIQVACLRLVTAGLIFALILLIKDPKGFKIKAKDIPLFLALGLVSILFFTCCYFTAIRLMTMSTAAILLYTSPIWVMVLSVIFLKEKITVRKITALILAFAGCVLVSGFGGKVTLPGILAGLGSGLGYGLYSIFGTFALRKYKPLTVTCYTFLIALNTHMVITNWVTSCGVYFLLRNNCPIDFRPGQEKFILLKIVTDEETSKVIFYEMELDTAETDMIMDTPVALWE